TEIADQYIPTTEELLRRAKKAYKELRAATKGKIDRRQIARHMGVSYHTLYHCKEVRDFFEEITAPFNEDSLLIKVNRAYSKLSATAKHRITQQHIAIYIGVTRDQLYHYEKVRQRMF